jgi:hypothetical protein
MGRFLVPPGMREFLTVSEVGAGEILASSLFQRKFQGPPPDFGKHIIAFYRLDESRFALASYLHIWFQNRIGLIGGGCMDGAVMAIMTPRHAATINREGGLLRQTLLYVFSEMRGDLDAFFGLCGDRRAKEIDLAAGFIETSDKHLLVNWVGALNDENKTRLFDQTMAIGPF